MSFWTAENVETLKRLVGDGHTAVEIAMTLRSTRSAILGKAHRLGLSIGRGKGAKHAALASSVKARAAKAKPSLPQVLSAPNSPVSDAGAGNKAEDLRDTVAMLGAAPEEIKETASSLDQNPSGDMQGQSSAGVTLFDLRRDSCRFPVAGEGIGTIFCGAVAEQGRSYCPACYPRTVTKSGGGAFVFNRTNPDRRAAA